MYSIVVTMKYHSTLSLRDHLRLLGLRGHSGQAAASVLHDSQEFSSSSLAIWKRPLGTRWIDRPTIEIDWDRMERFDARQHTIMGLAGYIGVDEVERLSDLMKRQVKQQIIENRPGYTLRDRALSEATREGAVENSFNGFFHNPDYRVGKYRGFGASIYHPDELGVPRWEGSPEENSRMIRTVARYFGAAQVGFVELNEHTRKLVYSFDDYDGKKIEFEDVELAYETPDKRVIPNKARWVIVFSVQMSESVTKRTRGPASTHLSASTTYLAYSRSRFIIDDLQAFLYMIGYQGLMGPGWNTLGIAPAFGVMAGIGELSRLNRIISPEYGPMQRIYRVITDLPLAPTKPIDAGIMRFCRTCKKCAEVCPVGALSIETEPSWEVKGQWNSPGHRAYFDDSIKCRIYWYRSTAACSTCLYVCPFTKKDRSFPHNMIAATIATTPVLNRFFTRMDGVLGYDKPKQPESWWNLAVPPYDI
ncbi:reductive dehalogenase [Chloroflexota bacterium]